MEETEPTPPARSRRRDALLNRERIVDAATELFAERGFSVPVSEIVDAAGVGIGTFYRSFPDRTSLLEELGMRGYAHVEDLLTRVEDEGLVGLVAVRRFLLGHWEIGDRLVLPLHGAPPLVSAAARAARGRIQARVQTFLDQARNAGAIVSDVNATDVILCAALISRPRRGGPTWERALRRHIEVFVAGLGQARAPGDVPVSPDDVEQEFDPRGA